MPRQGVDNAAIHGKLRYFEDQMKYPYFGSLHYSKEEAGYLGEIGFLGRRISLLLSAEDEEANFHSAAELLNVIHKTGIVMNRRMVGKKEERAG